MNQSPPDSQTQASFVRRLLSPFKTFGVVVGSLYLLDRLLSGVSPRMRLFCYEIMVQPMSSDPILPPRFAAKFTLERIEEGDSRLDLMPAAREITDSRFQQNARCLAVHQKDRFVGYVWLAEDTYDEDEVRCTFVLTPKEESVFDFDLYVFPEHRMGLAFVGLWNAVNEYLLAQGKKYSYSRLTRFNVQSRLAHSHLGWKRVARTLFLQLWQFELMLADIAPFVNVSIARNSRVKLALRPDCLEAGEKG